MPVRNQRIRLERECHSGGLVNLTMIDLNNLELLTDEDLKKLRELISSAKKKEQSEGMQWQSLLLHGLAVYRPEITGIG